ncbi:alpha-ketoacid dehydrogenase subunit beta [Nocardiopsis metallicus]|uniref:Pyruvate dehydrogenase E1 component beta subunit n=1 Tax=Nocardiopsis metallicus TaxID=179819 RepID=A0A840W4I7_9ACTN|nr:alpha-ketoacid dehydrogenase subunit beta [Nocardiopsis metallicus]MBB5491849.1 pyruvate dehydrogenase E1 component beta subunit [Nocardiopsis metallicus]
MTELIEHEHADTAVGPRTVELSMQQAINRALHTLLTEDPDVLVFGEDVGALGGVFRVTDGLQKEFGDQRVFDTPLAESAIMGMAVGLAMNGWRPVPELQFDGFAYPAIDQIVNQVARMNYRTRGAAPMPITLRLPSFGGIQAPEHHGESLEALFAHTPGLKVAVPADPAEAYSLLLQSVRSDDPVVFMEPKARYWDRRPVQLSEPTDPIGTSRIVRPGRHATLVAWGAMVHKCLQVAELAAEDGVELEVLDLRWLKPIDAAGLAASVARTKRAVVVHEAPLTAGLGAEVSTLITENCFRDLAAPVQRVTGFDVPYPAGPLEPQYLPTIDRVLLAVQRTLEY